MPPVLVLCVESFAEGILPLRLCHPPLYILDEDDKVFDLYGASNTARW